MYGFYIYNSSNNKITKNRILNNSCGIDTYYHSFNNIFYLNNFIDNSKNSVQNNVWNSPAPITYTYNGNTYTNYRGNYWDDYTGGDADGDGIGDTPYDIDSDKDNYPLMEPFEK